MFAKLVAEVPDDEIETLAGIAMLKDWEKPPNRYHTADVSDIFPEYKRAFFLKLPPHSGIHRHVDAGDCETDHIVIVTNPKCLNYWVDEDGEHAMHMEYGNRYTVNRKLEHWAQNDGETDRIHLLLEY